MRCEVFAIVKHPNVVVLIQLFLVGKQVEFCYCINSDKYEARFPSHKLNCAYFYAACHVSLCAPIRKT